MNEDILSYRKRLPAGRAVLKADAGDLGKLNDTIEEIAKAFSEFREKNEQRLAAIESKGYAPADVEQKVDEISAKITELEAVRASLEEIETKLNRPGGGSGGTDPDTEAQAKIFAAYLRGRTTPEVQAALQVDQDTGGGYLVATETFVNRLIQDMDNMLALRGMITSYTVGYEESLGFPSLDGDISAFSWAAGELTSATEDTGLSFGKRELKPHSLKRKLVKVSKRLLESPRFDTEGLVVDRVRVALAETLESAYMTGSGAGQPLGIFTASSLGISTDRDVSTGNTETSVEPDNLITVQGTLKEGYQPNAQWLFHRDLITALRKKKTGDGQYLWQPGLQAGQSNTVLGKPYVAGDYVPNTYTTGLYAGMYGDFSWYWAADGVTGMTIQRLIEKYAETGQIGLLFDRLSADGMPVKEEAFVRITMA